jgi:hypothetical protein
MIQDTFTRACLVLIVLMLGILTLQRQDGVVRAAPSSEYMIEGNSGQDVARVNAHMRARVAEGWTLHTFGPTFIVWQK